MNAQQERFCQHYVLSLNASEACIKAGYSKNGANSKGSQLLAIVSIQERVAFLKAKTAKKLEVKAEDIVKQLDILRRANISEYVELVTEEQTFISKEGVTSQGSIQVVKFKDFSELTEDQLSCIESIKQGKQGIELKLHGKEWTIEKLNKHIGFYEADNEQSKPESPKITVNYDGKDVDLKD